MNSFYEHHKDSIRWHYRCFDRILLNGLIQPFQQPERVVGFFNAYRQLYPVSRNTLRSIAEQFQTWLKAWTAKRQIPVMEAPQGRRDDFVDPYYPGKRVAVFHDKRCALARRSCSNEELNRADDPSQFHRALARQAKRDAFFQSPRHSRQLITKSRRESCIRRRN
jgi:hypothetical protein